MQRGINSSKVYCKYTNWAKVPNKRRVLIVAKCIVNKINGSDTYNSAFCINSSKVYCKLPPYGCAT